MTDISQSQLQTLSSGISSVLGGLQTQITNQIWAETFPLLGDGLQAAAQAGSTALTATDRLKTVLVNTLDTLSAAGAQTVTAVKDQLELALAAENYVEGVVEVAVVNGTEVVLNITKRTTGAVVQTLAQDLGMPGMELVTDAVATVDAVT